MGFGVEGLNAKMINIDILLTVLNGYLINDIDSI